MRPTDFFVTTTEVTKKRLTDLINSFKTKRKPIDLLKVHSASKLTDSRTLLTAEKTVSRIFMYQKMMSQQEDWKLRSDRLRQPGLMEKTKQTDWHPALVCRQKNLLIKQTDCRNQLSSRIKLIDCQNQLLNRIRLIDYQNRLSSKIRPTDCQNL